MVKAVLELFSKEKDTYNLPKNALTNLLMRDKDYRIAIEEDGDIVFGPVGKKELIRFGIYSIKTIKVKSYVENKRKKYQVVIKDRKTELLILNDDIYDLKEIEMMFVIIMEINNSIKVEL